MLKNFKKIFPNLHSRRFYKMMKVTINCSPVIIFILFSPVIFFVKILPSNFQSDTSKLLIFVHCFFAVYLWIMITFNYFAAMSAKPGIPPKKQDLNLNNYEKENIDTTSIRKDAYEFCSLCNCLRSYGTHHCMRCGICIRMLCHHSSIVNNCVGLDNYAYYFSFLSFSWIAFFYGIMMTYSLFYTCYLHNHNVSDISLIYPALSLQFCFGSGELPLLFILVLSAFIVISSLLALHILLLIVDMSYISFFKHLKRSSTVKNFVKDLWKKIFLRQRRIKYKILLRDKKMFLRDFLIPTFLLIGDEFQFDDYMEKHNCFEIESFSNEVQLV